METITMTVSNPNSSSQQPLVSDPTVENRSQRLAAAAATAKRKGREKKVKGSTKRSKNAANERCEDAEKLPYVHVQACRGQATDSHSLVERARRKKINARMKLLQELVPGCNKLIFDNITIVDSHRRLGFQIPDGGNVSDVTFSNINISTRYYDPSWWGRVEPIYVTTCPRHSTSKEGSISNLLFINITANSENGVILSGSKGGVLSNLRFINMNLTYRRWTNYAGGLVDYRPGCQGLVNHSVAGIIMEHIEGFDF